MKTKTYNLVLIVCFCLFIAGFAVINLLAPDQVFSERENRPLTELPTFSFENLISGKYTADFEKYTTDQFFARDFWVSMKSSAEQAIGKKENNGVYLLEGGALVERFDAPNFDRVDRNTAAVEKLAEKTDIPVYFTLIPGSIKLWEDRLPYGAPRYDQKELIDRIIGNLKEAKYIDTYSALYDHRNEEIYYRTDHHWTSLGAYYGYAEAIKGMGLAPLPLGEEKVVSDDFFGTAYSKSGVRSLAPDWIKTYLDPKVEIEVTDEKGTHPGTLYDESFLSKVDKYAYFCGGNHPLYTIKTEHTDAPKLLLFKDSYANSELPFLTQNFSEIIVVDLRFNKTPVEQYIAEYDIDMVLVSYSVSNFTSDTNIPTLGR